ncbi:MAG: trigger factor [Peptostreptococcaceae bacterium]
MKVELLKKEGTKVSFKMTIENDKFQDAVKKAYNKTKGQYNIPGFRKGKAPKNIIEAKYGKGVFFNDAIDTLFPEVYPNAIDELKLDVVDRPSIDIEEISAENGVVIAVEVDVMPEFEVANYRGIELKKEEVLVSSDEVEVELKERAARNARLISSENEIVAGNTAVIDYEGFDGGVAFNGGKGENHSLEIGSNAFIPGFEDQLVGKKAGEEVEVNVTFPTEYHAKELAGNDVVFKVKINEVKVKEVSELNDDFAKDTSEFDTLDELKEDIRKELQTRADESNSQKLKNDAIKLVAENTEVEIPNGMIERQIDNLLNQLNYQLQYQGVNIEQLLQMTGKTMKDLRDEKREDAKNQVRAELVLNKIASLENIEISEEEVTKEIEKMAEIYKIEASKLRESLGHDLENMKEDMKMKKVVDFLVENANIA